MIYSKEQVSSMSYMEWMETIARELNSAGFIMHKNFSLPFHVSEDNVSYFFMGAINKPKEMDYLKSIGLVNNGRCPMCGRAINGTPSIFIDTLHPGLDFHICSSCRREGQRVSINHMNNPGCGCVGALILMPLHLIRLLFS